MNVDQIKVWDRTPQSPGQWQGEPEGARLLNGKIAVLDTISPDGFIERDVEVSFTINIRCVE